MLGAVLTCAVLLVLVGGGRVTGAVVTAGLVWPVVLRCLNWLNGRPLIRSSKESTFTFSKRPGLVTGTMEIKWLPMGQV